MEPGSAGVMKEHAERVNRATGLPITGVKGEAVNCAVSISSSRIRRQAD